MTVEEQIFQRFRGKKVLLDANLLLLYMVGTFERNRIGRFKRTSGFSELDFDALVMFLSTFKTVVTTPHLLTEVSNLANSLPEHIKRPWVVHFSVKTVELLEVFEPATTLMQQPSFVFGLADAAVHEASKDTLILTEDFRLSGFLRSQGVAVLNFRDLILLAYLGAG